MSLLKNKNCNKTECDCGKAKRNKIVLLSIPALAIIIFVLACGGNKTDEKTYKNLLCHKGNWIHS